VGISFNVSFNKKVPPQDKLGDDHIALGAGLARLDKLAAARGLPTLGQFVSIDPEQVAELSGLDPEELGVPAVQWFDVASGLAAVGALAALLRDEPKVIGKAAALLADLEQVERELAAAKSAKHGSTFAC